MGENGVTPLASASRPGRLGRAVECFNQGALRFTRPGPRWLAASVKLGLVMKALAILVSVVVTAVHSALGYETPPSRFVAGRGVLELALLGVVLAPLFETALIWLVHALTRRWLGLTGFVLVNTILAYANHVPTTSVPIAAALVFTAMSYQYVSFRDGVGAGRAFAGVAVSHAVCNSIPTLIVAVESVLGRPIV